MPIKNEIVDELLKDVDPKKVFSSEGLLSDIKKALAERMLNAELDDHLQNEAAAATGNEPAACRFKAPVLHLERRVMRVSRILCDRSILPEGGMSCRSRTRL